MTNKSKQIHNPLELDQVEENKKLTEEDFKKLDKEADEFRKAVSEGTKDLENITGKDLKRIIK